MPIRRQLRALALLGCIGAAAAPRIALAQQPTAADIAAARKHFERARAYYGQGAYREAISELESAHTLDPSAKDLVFNLGVVHEKLSDIDEALNWFRLYTTMTLAPQERERADAYIRRLEGAKRELEEKLAAQQQTATSPTEPSPGAIEPPVRAVPPAPPFPATPQPPMPSPTPAPPLTPAPSAGRMDWMTVSAASISTASLAFGVVMGVMAISDRPPSKYVLGLDGTAGTLQDGVRHAHDEAVLADVGFSAALVSGALTAYLYFGRTRAVSTIPVGRSTVFAAPTPRGATLLLKGSF